MLYELPQKQTFQLLLVLYREHYSLATKENTKSMAREMSYNNDLNIS